MGAVYEAEPVQGEQPHVAIKLLHPEVLDRDPGGVRRARFYREARAASAIDAEHIVRVLDAGTDAAMDAPYLVMELLEGEDLDQVLARVGALSPDTALRIAAQVCLALDKAHGARVIHRDIKPANLFLARSPAGIVVKILDFGIAKIKRGPDDTTSGLTRPGTLIGSPRYMSPEQARSSRNIDFRTDLWSLGMVLYHALSGDLPHHDIANLSGLAFAIATSAPRLVPALVPWVPPEVVAVVHGALELEPAQRFPSAAAMLDVIRPLLPGGWSLDEATLARSARREATADAYAETRTLEPSAI
jgi:serine/threonine-protein kinase